ncbi:hypothetical protein BOTBODRAFT_358373 [Botryobasidium botryosum FD-172 SS1]|uniref:Uncharacterized protein n=1 Tax=Botryobasidium botryosum (strain FD-172 SS1) TaxID=930990 RepID=A0A067ME48_BOTB1|nr:hypothetical protein BOTBODRAFT_358373 [Botryobasidium botryosum FD-172 SS1]
MVKYALLAPTSIMQAIGRLLNDIPLPLLHFDALQDALFAFRRRLQLQATSLSVPEWRASLSPLADRFAARLEKFQLPEDIRLAVPLSIALFLILVVIPLRICRSRTTPTSQHHALAILLLLICPARGAIWPKPYLRIAGRAQRARLQTIVLPLEDLVRDVCDRKLELRNPQVDMKNVTTGRIKFHDWSITFRVGWRVWLRALGWWSSVEVPLEYAGFFRFRFCEPPEILHSIMLKEKSINLDVGSSIVGRRSTRNVLALAQRSTMAKLHLSTLMEPDSLEGVTQETHHPSNLLSGDYDSISRSQLKPATRLMQSKIPRNATSYLELSACPSRDVSRQWHLSNDEWIMIALPYINPLNDMKLMPGAHARTTAPFTTSLAEYVALLTSGPHALTVRGIHDVTKEYVTALRTPPTRGVPGATSEDRYAQFMNEWEAGFYCEHSAEGSPGLLKRYIIVVES